MKMIQLRYICLVGGIVGLAVAAQSNPIKEWFCGKPELISSVTEKAISSPPKEPSVKVAPTKEQGRNLPLSYAPIVKQTAPAVVSIFALQVSDNAGINPFLNDPFFRFFFGEDPGSASIPRHQMERSLGSGVIITKKGIVVTCAHVVRRAKTIQVKLGDNREYEAEVIGMDDRNDLALLKIKDSDQPFPYIDLGESDQAEVGDIILAVGNPFGVGQTVTSGIISATHRPIGNRLLLQTDAAINPGNSGGALVDLTGKLVGIPNAILSKTGSSIGVGFGIPVIHVKLLLESFEKGAKMVYPWSGISVQTMTSDMASSLGLKQPKGVLVRSVHKASPALASGVKQGDIITDVNGHSLTSEEDFHFQIETIPLNQTVQLTVLRQGKEETMQLKMIAPPEDPPADETVLSDHHLLTGVKVANLSPAIASLHGLDENRTGVVILDGGNNRLVARLGIHTGDIIEKINGTQIQSVSQLKEVLVSSKAAVSLVIRRGDQQLAVTVR